jgi:hypothetical protein
MADKDQTRQKTHSTFQEVTAARELALALLAAADYAENGDRDE